MTDAPRPDTIVLVHGLWMTPRSWEHWVAHYEAQGLHGAHAGLPRLRDRGRGAAREPRHHREPHRARDRRPPRRGDRGASATPPIIMGHSFGGTLTQLLLARGLGLGRGGHRLRADRGRPGEPALPGQVAVPGAEEPGQPAQGRRASRPRSSTTPSPTPSPRRTRGRSGTATPSPAPGNWVWEYGLIANFKPGHQETWVDYAADRAPLLFIGGEKDHIMPPSVNRSNAKHYKKSPAADRVPRVRGPRPLDLRRARLGGGRRPRAGVGPRAQPDRTGTRRRDLSHLHPRPGRPGRPSPVGPSAFVLPDGSPRTTVGRCR